MVLTDGQLSTLRKDLLVARTLYKLLLGKLAKPNKDVSIAAPVTYEELKEALSSYGLNDRQSSVAIDMLFDQGMLKTEWQGHTRGLQIAGEATSYVRAIYEKTEGLAA